MIRPGLLLDVADLDGLDAVLLDTRLTTDRSARTRAVRRRAPARAPSTSTWTTTWPRHPGSGGRHPLPEPERFVAAMRRAGVRRDSTVVVVRRRAGHRGRTAVVAAARLRPRGRAGPRRRAGCLGRLGPTRLHRARRTAHPRRLVGHAGASLGRSTTPRRPCSRLRGVLLDVRAAERFRGETEPIDPVAGHVPGAVNAPLTEITDELGRFRSPEALRSRFDRPRGPRGRAGRGVLRLRRDRLPDGAGAATARGRRRPLRRQLERLDHRRVTTGRDRVLRPGRGRRAPGIKAPDGGAAGAVPYATSKNGRTRDTASVRLCTSRRRKTFSRCLRTVASDSPRSRAIWVLLAPVATRRRTSH